MDTKKQSNQTQLKLSSTLGMVLESLCTGLTFPSSLAIEVVSSIITNNEGTDRGISAGESSQQKPLSTLGMVLESLCTGLTFPSSLIIGAVSSIVTDNRVIDGRISPEQSVPLSSDLIPITDHEKVFIVHGHDHIARDTVENFVKGQNLTATILGEQSNEGRTLIEKFEDLADEASFAIVLITPDDVGASEENRCDLKPRARQNVIFELGYFFKAVGRQRVCILHKGNVELPSDIQGVVYVPLDDAGEWRQKVIKEMEAAGLLIDINEI